MFALSEFIYIISSYFIFVEPFWLNQICLSQNDSIVDPFTQDSKLNTPLNKTLNWILL